ncbi:unnamed protein product [Medioppia subpectinata]|uniref:C2H2-type domain-containing protein n=1 Tax=Medioppia subpectinata TaxID=1979941 RepID=A0A7R9L516_9ACAR|nr:unnamed protein product [Medioppia subpectinata]CAG2115410.1 unnamed protein product [Medioppia subpectinata]
MNEDTTEDTNDLILRPNVSEVLKDNCVEPMNGLNIEKHTLVNNTSNPLISHSSPQEMVNEEIIDISNEDSMEDSMQPKLLTEFLPQSVRRSDRQRDKSNPLTTHALICPPNAGQKTFNLMILSPPITQSLPQLIVTQPVNTKRLIPRIANPRIHSNTNRVIANKAVIESTREELIEKIKSSYSSRCALDMNERRKFYDLNTKTYICPINECHKSGQKDVWFWKHLKTTHSNKLHVCDFEGCGKGFKTNEHLKQHSFTHKAIKSFKCHYNGCQYRGVSRRHLTQHMKKHSTDRVFKCDVSGCGKTFTTQTGLWAHRRTHKTEPTYKCGIDDCNDMFYTASQRTKHQVMVHNRRPYNYKRNKHRCQWPGCDWMGTDMNAHQRIHTGDKPFACVWPDCGKRFTAKYKLREHMNIHNNVKPFACHWPGCQYTSASNANVIKHAKQVHKV